MHVTCPRCSFEMREFLGWNRDLAKAVTTLLQAGYVGPITIHCTAGLMKSLETRETARGSEAPEKAIEWSQPSSTRSDVRIVRDSSGTIEHAERRLVYSVR